MPKRPLNLPDTASVAHPVSGDRLSAPSAIRNVHAIRDVLAKHGPRHGRALEIASGTGQHVADFAGAFPDIIWQPTDIDPVRLDSIRDWTRDQNARNIHEPLLLDATKSGWADALRDFDLILTVNLLHLISEVEARVLISESARALRPGGMQVIYGPFLRPTGFASGGDEKFHDSLVRQDPMIGYKSFQVVQEWQTDAGLNLLEPIEMPANNLTLIARALTAL